VQSPGNEHAAAQAERGLTKPFAAFATGQGRRVLGCGAFVVAVAVAVMICLPKRYPLIVEPLLNPVAVTGWTTDSLQLADGREIPLPDVHELPLESEALTVLTKRGVEIGADGRPVGQVQLRSWCGNCDAGARRHFMRVDVADALIYLGIAQTGLPEPRPGFRPGRTGGDLQESGWEITEFRMFDVWQGSAAEARRKRASE